MSLSLSIFTVLAQGDPPGASPFSLLIPILIFIGVIFIMNAFTAKKRKELEQKVAAAKPGDEILTQGGFFAKVTGQKKDRLVVRLGQDTKCELAKSYVVDVYPKGKGSGGKEEATEEKESAEPDVTAKTQ